MNANENESLNLLLQIQQGSEAAFSKLYDLHWKKLFVMANNRLGNIQEAEDVVSDIFCYLWINRNDLTIHTSLESFLSIMLKNKVLDILRKRKVRENYQIHLNEVAHNYFNAVEEKLNFDELYARWSEEVNKLPEQCSIIYKMSVIEELSTKEISDRLTLSPRTVENHKYRAIKALRTKLSFSILFLIIFS